MAFLQGVSMKFNDNEIARKLTPIASAICLMEALYTTISSGSDFIRDAALQTSLIFFVIYLLTKPRTNTASN